MTRIIRSPRRLWASAVVAAAAFVGLAGIPPLALRLAAQEAPTLVSDTDAPAAAQQATFTIMAGDVFEIMAVTDAADGFYSWVVTKDGAFVEAGRERVFHLRLTEPGTYQLDAAVEVPSTGLQQHRVLTIAVQPRHPEQNAANAASIVDTLPVERDGTITLSAQFPVLRITPSPSVQNPINLDENVQSDTDGDGDPADDQDDAATLFHTEKNALYLWLVSPILDRTMRVYANGGGSAPQERLLHVVVSGDAVPVEFAPSSSTGSGQAIGAPDAVPGEIVATQQGRGNVSFSLQIDNEDPLHQLYHWNFGDGAQSLLTKPVHRYVSDGDYPASVQVIGIDDGRVLATGKTDIVVTDSQEATGSGAGATSSAQSSEASSATAATTETPPETASPPAASTGGGGGTLLFLAEVAGVGLLAILVGAILVVGVMKLLRRTGGLQKKLEEAEPKIMESGGKSVIDMPPPPMELKRSDEPKKEEKEEEKKEEKTEEPESLLTPEERAEVPPPEKTVVPPADFVNVETAPSWLKKGLSKEAASAPAADMAEPPAPPSEPEPPPSWPVSPPAANTSAPAKEEPEAALPPWLQQTPTQEAPSSPAEPPPSEEAPPPAPAASDAEATQHPTYPADDLSVTDTSAVPSENTATVTEPSASTEQETAAEEPVPPPPPSESSDSDEPQHTEADAAASPSAQQDAKPAASGTESSAEEQARLERERERKRRKRQRYRENQRKRKEGDAPQPEASSAEPAASPVPEAKPASDTAKPTPAPAAPAAPPQTASADANLPSWLQQASSPAAPPPLPVASTSPSPFAPVTPPLPASASSQSAPAPAAPPAPAKDSDVAFMVRADGIAPPPPPAPEGPKDPGTQA